MADYSLTSSSVLKGANGTSQTGIAGGTIAAGQPLYRDSADSDKLKAADANASLATSTVVGLALNAAYSGQPVAYLEEDDDYTHGLAGVAAGDVIILSATAGGLCPVADLTTGWYSQVVAVAKSSTKAVVKLVAAGVVRA